MIKPYFPDLLDDQRDWYANFIVEFPSRAARLKFTPAETDNIVSDCSTAVWALTDVRALAVDFQKTINGWVRAQLFGPNGAATPADPLMPVWPVHVDTALQGIDERRQAWVQRLKNSTGYDKETDGPALRVEQTGDPFVPAAFQALVRSISCTGPSEVRLKVAKASGAIDANKIRMRLSGAVPWTDLGNFTNAEIFDRTPVAVPGQPEQREYQAQGVIKDQVIGIPSDIETVIVQG